MARLRYATLVAACLSATPTAAQNVSIVGVWRSSVEGTPSGLSPHVTSSDVQKLTLTADGHYRREITVEGGNGVVGAAGTIIDSGLYRFTPPETLQYSRQSWVICTYTGCLPGTAPPPNEGTLPFQLTGPGQATFLGLTWTKIQ
jgi:hypothetical protein